MNDEYYGDAIYDGNKLTVSNSILLTNSNNGLIYSDGEDNVPYAQNCWWGTNDDPSSLNGVGYYEDDDWEEYDCPPVDVSNWVTMDASFTPADAQSGDEVTVTAVFSNANLPDGINVTFTSTSGLNIVVSTVAGQASTTYTIDANDEAINATSGNATIEMPIAPKYTTNIVTQDNFYDFFDDSGFMNGDIPYDELIFKGEFTGLAYGYVIISEPISIVGDEALLKNMGIVVSAGDVSLANLTFDSTMVLGDLVNVVSCDNVNLTNLTVTYNVTDGQARAISIISAQDVIVENANITFESHITDSGTDACAINIENSENVLVTGSEINSSLPALTVNYNTVTSNFMGLDQVNPVRVMKSNKVNIVKNTINSKTNKYSQAPYAYETIQAMLIVESNDCLIDSNNISLTDEFAQSGQDVYLYGISFAYDKNLVMSNNNFTIYTNGGKEAAGTAYGIQGIESELSIIGNNITTFSNGPNLAIYITSMAGEPSVALIENNILNVTGLAAETNDWALVSGIEIQNGDVQIYNNTIYTYNVDEYNEDDYLSGISYVQWMYGSRAFDIQDNTIYTEGKYAIYLLAASDSTITGNTLYAHNLTGDDAVYIGSGENNNVGDNLPPYEGIIYVNATGDDSNKGSINAPVATIAKAVELAQGKSGQIIIDEGTYDCPQVEITDDLDISTVGEVVLKAQDATKKAFFIKSGDVSISNLTFTNFNATYSGSVIRLDAGSLTLNGTKFIKNGGENQQALIQVKNSDLTLVNSVFDHNTARTGTAYGTVYVSAGTLYVDNCNFTNNFNKYGALYISSSIATIYNSSFIGHNATSASGGSGGGIYVSGTATYISSYSGNLFEGASSYILVEGCSFINNSAKGARLYAGQGGAIYVGTNVTMFISDCLFENNTCTDNTGDSYEPGQGGAIYAAAGNIHINKSIFKNNDATEGSEIYLQYKTSSILHPEELNTLTITNSIILNDGVAILATSDNGTYVANNNWWGTNDEPSDKVVNVVVDSWAKMNATFTPREALEGEVNITAEFDNPELPDGIEVTFTSTSGNLNTVVAAKDGKATATYTIDATDDAIIATSTDAVVEMPIIKPLANITVTADPAWIGTNGNVTVNVPNATGTVTIKVNGKEYEVDLDENGTATKEIPAEDLVAGDNNITATYNGHTFAANSNYTNLYVADGVITNATYPYYFDASGNLAAFVPDGATLDFQGLFLGKFPVYIDKSVNVISSTGDALFNSGDTYAGNAVNSFNIIAGGDNTNITGLDFINYCLYIKGASNVTVDGVSIVANKRGVGSGTGFLSIHTGAYNTVVKNGYFENGGTGSSLLVLGKGGAYALFDHNVFNITGSSGNILSANQFVGTGDAPEHVSYTNNVLYNNQPGSAFCYAMTVSGSGNLVENNTIYHNGSGILNQYGASSSGNVYRNNTLYGNTNFNPSANSIVENNKIYAATNIAANTTAVNNVFKNVAISGTNTTFTNNNVSGTVTVNGNNNRIEDNTITTADTYAVDLKSTTGNNVTGNYLIAKELYGQDAVNAANRDADLIEENRPINPEIVVKVDNITVGEDALIDVTLNENATGTVVVNVNGETYDVEITAGKGSVPVSGLAPSDYTVTATFSTSDVTKFGDGKNSTVFNVAKLESEVNIAVSDAQLGNDTVITVSIPGATGNVTVIVNGKEEEIPLDENGNATYTIDDIAAGDYNVVAIYPGDKDHGFAYAAETFTVDKLASEVNVTVKAGSAGEKSIIEFNVTEGATGTVVIDVNGTRYVVDVADGKLEVVLDAGDYSVVATYDGDDSYDASVSDAETIVVSEKQAANVQVEIPDDIKVGDKIIINVTADTNAEIIVYINGEAQTFLLQGAPLGASLMDVLKYNLDKKVAYEVTQEGIYNVTVIAKENEDYAAQTVTKIFEANKKDAEITIGEITADIGDTVTINATTESDGALTIKVNGETVTGEYPITKAGTYTVVVESAATDAYNAGFATYTFEVAEPTEQNITVVVDGKEYNATVVNGTATVDTDMDDVIANLTDELADANDKVANLTDVI